MRLLRAADSFLLGKCTEKTKLTCAFVEMVCIHIHFYRLKKKMLAVSAETRVESCLASSGHVVLSEVIKGRLNDMKRTARIFSNVLNGL